MRSSQLLTVPIFLFGLALSFAFAQPSGEKIDWDRARQIYQRMKAGEKLTAEERAYLEDAKAVRQGQRATNANNRPPLTAKSETGFKPLCDMTAEDRYKGEDGGLYGGGKNEPPEKHLAAALAAAREIRPL